MTTIPSILILTLIGFGASQGTLRRLQVVFRHGIRAPVEFAWNDTCFNQSQLGMLTQNGRTEMAGFGDFLRTRYDQFLGNCSDNVTVYSSYLPRCFESASLVINGMFATENVCKIPETHNMSVEVQGPLLTNQSYWDPWPASFKQLNDYKPLVKAVRRHVPVQTMMQLTSVSDQMICELAQCCPLPSWVERLKKELLGVREDLFTDLLRRGSEKIVYENSDGMRQQIIQQFNTSDPQYNEQSKTTLLAWNDVPLETLLIRLGVYDCLPVPFGAALILELHDIDNVSVVRLFYDNTPGHVLTQLRVPGCQLDCPLQRFVDLTEKIPAK